MNDRTIIYKGSIAAPIAEHSCAPLVDDLAVAT